MSLCSLGGLGFVVWKKGLVMEVLGSMPRFSENPKIFIDVLVTKTKKFASFLL